MFGVALALTFFIVSTFLLLSILISIFRTGVPTLASARKAQMQIGDYLQKNNVKIIYELGSGKGDFVFRLAEKNPQAKIVGFEISPAPLLFAKLRRLFHPARKRVAFRLTDFHKVDFSEIDALAFYLMPGPNKKVEPKLEKELKKGAIVASVSFSMPGWEPNQVLKADNHSKTRSYIYHMPARKK